MRTTSAWISSRWRRQWKRARRLAGLLQQLQEGPRLRVAETVLGTGEQTLTGRAQGGVAGEVDIADREQAEGVEAASVPSAIDAAVVVVAAQAGDLLELLQGDGGAISQQRAQRVSATRATNDCGYSGSATEKYDLKLRGVGGLGVAGIKVNQHGAIDPSLAAQIVSPSR